MQLTAEDISGALSLAPLGERSDFDLNPEPAKTATAPRPAAVLCGLVPRSTGLRVVLTRRASHLRHHAGQISFPGGKLEAADATPLDAALREAEEEIGLASAMVRVLGRLDPYLTGTGFRVHPFVGVVDPTWQPACDPSEVDEVFEAPLDHLMDPANCIRSHYERDGRRRYFYAIPWQERYIWGATAGMLKALSDRIRALRAAGDAA
ncbi:MAG: CoA pyrophosphatase [Pseudomonadota bacterium]